MPRRVSLCPFSAHSVANSLSQSVRTRCLELPSHAGSVVYALFFVSCEISPSKKYRTLVYLQIQSVQWTAYQGHATKDLTEHLDSRKHDRLVEQSDFLARQQ